MPIHVSKVRSPMSSGLHIPEIDIRRIRSMLMNQDAFDASIKPAIKGKPAKLIESFLGIKVCTSEMVPDGIVFFCDKDGKVLGVLNTNKENQPIEEVIDKINR